MSSDTYAATLPAARRLTGRSVRRWFLIAAPVLAGLLAILGAAADPAVGESGRPLYEKYAANPDPLQWKSFGFHYSFAFWCVGGLLLAGLVRSRGIWIANVGGVLAFLGLSTLPGFLIVDFYDSAIGQVAGVDAAVQVEETMESMWAVSAIALPGMIGFLACLPVAALAAWRAGLVRWWAPAAVVGAQAAFMFSSVAVWGTVLTAIGFSIFAVALARIDPRLWQGEPA
jgi:hypothetical protein